MKRDHPLYWSGSTYTVWDINPQPWTPTRVPKRGSSVKDGKLADYQEAVREAVENALTDHEPYTGNLTVKFYFWRSTAHGNQADATNLQKATEDALQYVLYGNDRANRHVCSEIIEQNVDERPCIIIVVEPYKPSKITKPEPPREVGRFEDDTWEAPEEELF